MSFLLAPDVSGTVERDLGGTVVSRGGRWLDFGRIEAIRDGAFSQQTVQVVQHQSPNCAKLGEIFTILAKNRANPARVPFLISIHRFLQYFLETIYHRRGGELVEHAGPPRSREP